ncbi:MAG: hypothetical protein WAT71_17515 [Ignavibacteria bacterium]
MKPSDDLFLLIKSLSSNEKNFFRKKYIALLEDADGNYLKLFNDISKQTIEISEYDENEIKEGKYSGKFIKNLSFNKNFLYNFVLNSLADFNKEHKDIFYIRNLLTQSEILSDKMLNEQSLKLLQRAEKISQEKDLHYNNFEVLNFERLILRNTTSVEDYIKSSSELFTEQYDILEIQKNSLDYYRLNETVGIFLRINGSGKIREKEKLLEFEKIFDTPLLKNIDNAKTFICRYIFYNLNLQYHLTKENYDEGYECARLATELCRSNIEKLKGKLNNYIYSLSNLMNCQTRAKKFSEFENTVIELEKIADIYPKMITESNRVFIFYTLAVTRLSKNITDLNIKRLEEIEVDIQNSISKYEDKITLYQRIILYFFLSVANFIQSKFDNCIYWNSKIFNLGKSDMSEDYQCYARILQLLSYFELKYFDALEYTMKSAYHFISKKKKNYKYENIIQKYLRRSFRIKTDSELREMFIEMKDELEIIYKDEYEKNAFDAFNIIYWLESKIRKIPFVEAIKLGIK